jgi:LuxR family transcriptional regulator, quorum-sensing system regulator SolR
MTPWQSELFDRLKGAGAAQVCERLARATSDIGFRWYEYSVWHPLPLSNPRLHTLGNTPAPWRQRYEMQRYWAVDPVVSHARRSLEPLIWNDEVFQRFPALHSDAQRHGLRYGWTMASLNPNGQRGMLTVSRDKRALHAEEADALESSFSWLVYLAHMFLAEKVARQHDLDGHTELTPREAEVLRWIGDGKSSAEISCILSISTDTVNFHLRNAMEKLNASNRTSAVVTALVQGQLLHA